MSKFHCGHGGDITSGTNVSGEVLSDCNPPPPPHFLLSLSLSRFLTHTPTHSSLSEVRGLRMYSVVVHKDTENLCVVWKLMETLALTKLKTYYILTSFSVMHTHSSFPSRT